MNKSKLKIISIINYAFLGSFFYPGSRMNYNLIFYYDKPWLNNISIDLILFNTIII